MNNSNIIQQNEHNNLLFTVLNNHFYHYPVFNDIDDLQRLNSYFYKGSGQMQYINKESSQPTMKIECNIKQTFSPIKQTSYNKNVNSQVLNNSKNNMKENIILNEKEQEKEQEKQIVKENTKQIVKENTKQIVKENTKQMVNNNRNNECFTPNHKNTLFWCVYIQIYGLDEYNDIKINGHFLQRFVDKRSILSNVPGTYANIEYAERIKIIKSFQENTEKRKESNVKLTKVLMNELLSGILADIETSISSLYLFSIHYNQNIYLVNNENRTYIKFGTKLLEETDDDSYKKKIVIYYQSNNKKQKYYIDISTSSQSSNYVKENFEETYFELESLFKPMKGMSNYTVGNLHEIANKIGLVMEKMPKKQELYDEIVKHIAWNF